MLVRVKSTESETSLFVSLFLLPACHLRMRIRTPLMVIEIMAVAMQTEDFPYLPSGPAEGMAFYQFNVYFK